VFPFSFLSNGLFQEKNGILMQPHCLPFLFSILSIISVQSFGMLRPALSRVIPSRFYSLRRMASSSVPYSPFPSLQVEVTSVSPFISQRNDMMVIPQFKSGSKDDKMAKFELCDIGNELNSLLAGAIHE
jgi:hypothetical protein